MATLTSTIKKAEKVSGQTIQRNGLFYFVDYKGYNVSFAQNGMADEADNFYTTNTPRTENDHNSDYFPGTFHDNLTQAFKFVDRKIERNAERRYKELKEEFLGHQFKSSDSQMQELIASERVLIAQGKLQPIWAN